MTRKSLKKFIDYLKGYDFTKYKANENGELATYAKIAIEVVDSNFGFGYDDYFFTMNIENEGWFERFIEYLKKDGYVDKSGRPSPNILLIDTIYQFNVKVRLFNNKHDLEPFGTWYIFEWDESGETEMDYFYEKRNHKK